MKPSQPAFDKWWGNDRDPLVSLLKSALNEAFSAGFAAGLQDARQSIKDTFPEVSDESAG